ncbi:MAG: DUF928 domain-containing protein [Oscillatoria sp. SIO1A7]|nr:DUF928 domain-containing protein [Oscillatoria sp. SIO1A7]
MSAPVWAETLSNPDGSCLVGSEEEAVQLQKNNYLELNEGKEPIFVVYVPESLAEEASFTLQDEFNNIIYQSKVPLPEEGGMVSIAIPQNLSELESGKDYQWLLEIHCTPEVSPENPIMQGWVKAI